MGYVPQPLIQDRFNVALDAVIKASSPHQDSWGFLRAVTNPEFTDLVMIDGYKRHIREQAKSRTFLITVDLQTPQPINKNPQWLLNQLGSQTDVFPARKNYHYDDISAGFWHTELLCLYNLHTLTNKKGKPQDDSLELLLSLFRNDHLARVLIPNTKQTWEVIGHHRFGNAFMPLDLTGYLA